MFQVRWKMNRRRGYRRRGKSRWTRRRWLEQLKVVVVARVEKWIMFTHQEGTISLFQGLSNINTLEPVLRATNRNNENYCSPNVPAMTKILLEDVEKIFKTTTGTPFMIPTTGH